MMPQPVFWPLAAQWQWVPYGMVVFGHWPVVEYKVALRALCAWGVACHVCLAAAALITQTHCHRRCTCFLFMFLCKAVKEENAR